MKTRNPIYNALGGVDLEIEHAEFGWMHFTASPDDPEQVGRDLHAQELASGGVAAYVAPPPPPAPTDSPVVAAIKELADGLPAEKRDAVLAKLGGV